MQRIVVKIKNKKQEKAVTTFLEDNAIDYNLMVQDEKTTYTPKKRASLKKNSKAKKKLINEIKEAVKFINLVKQGKRKGRPVQELLDEL